MAELNVGERAPDLVLPTGDGDVFSLGELRGGWVVLYFYPKDDTEACTAEAIDFSALKAEFAAAGATIVGVSPDSPKRHSRFATKYALSVKLASDEQLAAANTYGVWVEKSMYGRKYMGVERSTFLIDANGVIQQVWRKVRVRNHAREVLEAILARG